MMIRSITKRPARLTLEMMSSSSSTTTRRISQGLKKNFRPPCMTASSSLNAIYSSDIVVSRRSLSSGAGIGNVENKILPSTFAENKLFKHCKHPRTASIIGAPQTYGQPFVGTDSGPRLLREGGLATMLTQLGWRVEDIADLDFNLHEIQESPDPSNARNCALVGHASNILADVVETKIKEGLFPLILGGDHSVAIGSLTGILRARPNTGIIWVDAHADLNTPETSGSGNLHGMPLGLLMDHPDGAYDFSKLPGFDFLVDGPRISPEQLVYVGLRDVDPTERLWIKDLGIKTFTMTDVDNYGIGQVMSKALDYLKGRPLHLSYDIDSVDPVHAPATGTRVRGGLTYREAHFVGEIIARSGNLASAEIVEVNPSLSDDDGANETVELGLQLITSFMGKSII